MRIATVAHKKPLKVRSFSTCALRDAKVNKDGDIVGFAVVTRGEALGHGVWLDNVFLDQVVVAGNGARRGIRARFTHPGLSSDGLGSFLGRVHRFRRDGDVVPADLEFDSTASDTPRGDLADYVQRLAASDPEAFGASIVYSPDFGEEDRFRADHTDENGAFKSPDKANTKNLIHARLSELHATDLVDEPAANPGGFFSDDEELASRAEDAMEYLFGLSDVTPHPAAFGGIAPERARAFVLGFLHRHETEGEDMFGLGKKKETEMAATVEVSLDAAGVARLEELEKSLAAMEIAASVDELHQAFTDDSDFVVDALSRGLTLTEAKAERFDAAMSVVGELGAEIAELKVEQGKLRAERDEIDHELLSGAEAVEASPEVETTSEDYHTALKEKAAQYRKDNPGTSIGNSYKAVAKDHEENFGK